MDEATAMLSIQPMLWKIVREFASKYHLDAEELCDEMQFTALKAVRTWKPGGRTLCSWTVKLVTDVLYYRIQWPGFREQYGLKVQYETVLQELEQVTTFNLSRLLMELSEEAADTVQLVLQEGIDDQSYIESVLASSFGWTEHKIKQIFAEVHDALQP